MGFFQRQTVGVNWLGSAEPNRSAIIILMLMMSAELQRHPCDLIKPNLGQSILAAAEHLNIIITLLHPHLCAHLATSEPGPAWPGHKQLLLICLLTTCPAFRRGPRTFSSFGSEFHHDPNQKWDFVFKDFTSKLSLSACGTCSLGFSSAAIFDGMQ